MPYKDPEKERERQKIRRIQSKHKEYQRKYQQEWRAKNPDKWKSIRKKSESSPKRKLYLSNWWKTSPKAQVIRRRFNESIKSKEYHKKWNMTNPEKIKKKDVRYYNSIKGIVNYLKKNERRKFKIEPKNITPELISAVNQRDKNCVYCGKTLPDKPTNKNDVHYDHLNPFKSFSEINMVRCCGSCNHQKSNGHVLEWCEYKGYKPAKIVYDLLDKDKNN